MRYRLQRKERIAMPCIIGNKSMPLPTYRWKDIAVSDDFDALLTYYVDDGAHRIIDTADSDKIMN